MPRIDPLQLLKCLSVLLTPEGGILSRDEVPRLVSLMTKFSKKLVSKCVYVLILSNTETSLLELFMAEGGWTLIQTWLEDAMKTCNDDLVVEILNLLLITPVDIERLKSNTIPRLVKTLTKREGNGNVKELSTLLVQKWLAIVKSTTQELAAQKAQSVEQTEQHSDPVEVAEEVTVNEHQMPEEHEAVEENNETSSDNKDAISTGSFYKLTVRGGKQVISRLSSSENEAEPGEEETSEHATNKTVSETEDKNKESEKKKSKSDKDKSKSKSSSSSSKSSSSKSSSHKEKDKDKHKSSSSSKSSSRDKEKSSSNRDKEKDRERDKERKDRDKDKHRPNGVLKHSSSSSKDKERRESKDKDRKDRKDKDKESKDKHSDKDSKDPKEKQAEKDKDTLAKIKPHTLDKIGRIPKKSSSDKPKEGEKDKQKDGEKTKEIDRPKENDKPKENKDQKKKGSISIEVRKNTEERPKTVKIFNSKMRSTGLEEEVKPPPPRNAVKKVQPTTVLPSIPQKRPSPPRDGPLIPEKKVKLDIVDRPVPERPGAIKLIPPKPKPMILQESDIFMDALNASATAKKEPKKRKRRPSVSKDPTPTSPTSSASSPTKEESSGATSPPSFKNIAPPNFYQDTLETGEKDVEMKDIKDESPESPDITLSDLRAELRAEDAKEEKVVPDDSLNTSASTTEIGVDAKKPKTEGLKGVLVYIKKKGPKRSVKWKADEDLVEIRHFELDETERVNVTKTFMDMAKMEMTSEREALQLSRKLAVEDTMEAQISWRFPYLVDQPEPKTIPGCNSLEKDIQFAREKNVLQALYFHKRMIPDSPAEPLPETHPMSDPVVIPLEDPECQEIDLRNTPWPEPKSTPPVEPPVSIAPMFRNVQQPQPQPFQNFQPMNPGSFQGMPRFQGPVGHGGPGQMPDAHQMMDAPAFLGPQSAYGHPNMMNHNIMSHPNIGHPEMMGQGPIDPGMFGLGGPGPMGPPNGPMQGPDGFDHMMNDGSGFQGGYDQPNMGMFHHQNNSNNNYEMNRPPCNDREDGGGRGRGRGRGYHHRRGGGGSGGGGGGWVRLNNGPSHHGSGSWRGGGGPNRTNTNRVCKNVKNHGYCRNVDTCPFIHPN